MRRREFITLAGGAVAAWPLTAFGKAQRIAIVLPSFPVGKINETSGNPLFNAFFKELRRSGYVEGQSLLIERYSGDGRAAHLSDLARDVVSHNPDVIVSIGDNELTLGFKAATTTIPIVASMGVPVGWHCSEPGATRRQYHRGLCRCRARAIGKAGSNVAGDGAASGPMRIPRIARTARAVGTQRAIELGGSSLGWPGAQSSDGRG